MKIILIITWILVFGMILVLGFWFVNKYDVVEQGEEGVSETPSMAEENQERLPRPGDENGELGEPPQYSGGPLLVNDSMEVMEWKEEMFW